MTFGSQAHAGASSSAPPSIVVVICDDVSWEDIDAASTTAIDALMSEGVTFRGFHAMPVCSTTRVALWTGLYPRRMGIGEGVSTYLPPGDSNPAPAFDFVTLPRLLKRAGYRTALFGKWHAGPFVNEVGEVVPELAALDAGGFDYWRAGSPANLKASGGTGYFSWFRADDGEAAISDDYATSAQVFAAIDWWREQECKAAPLFMAVSLNAPHAPFHRPPDGWFRDNHGTGKTAEYLMMLESVDIAVDMLRDAVGPDVWFIFVSDNGTPPNTNGSSDIAKTTTLRRGVNVPLVIVPPKSELHFEHAGLCQITDIYATVAEIVGLEYRAENGGLDSLSILPAVFDPTADLRSHVMAERYSSNAHDSGTESDDFMVRSDHWKLRRVDDTEILYDLGANPFELAFKVLPANLSNVESAALQSLLSFELKLPARL